MKPCRRLWLIALFAVACSGRPAPHRPNLLIVCVDALRADALGTYGSTSGATPMIDRIAAESVVFENAFSVASWTKPTVPTILTGLYPSQHGVLVNRKETTDILADRIVTLAERLSAAGYQTGAFVENAQLNARSSGLNQGFSVYEEELGDALHVTHRFLRWLERGDRRPFFAYVHVLDPHLPYRPEGTASGAALTTRARLDSVEWGMNTNNWRLLRSAVREGVVKLGPDDALTLRGLYDGEVAFTDAVLGRLFDLLKVRGYLQSTLVMITADHGEGFLEHGKLDHGYGPYDELIHIPLIVHLPGNGGTGRRVHTQVSQVDITPTILDAAGLDKATELPGRSLLKLAPRADQSSDQPVLTIELIGKESIASLRTPRFKYMRSRDTSAPGTEVANIELPSDLTVGTRIRARGVFAGGIFLPERVYRLDAGDRDVEITAPITAVAGNHKSIELLSTKVVAIETRLPARDRPVWNTLTPLQWVKVQGAPKNGVFRADRVEARSAHEVEEPEIEGVIQKLYVDSGGDIVIELPGWTLYVGRKVEWKGFTAETKAMPIPRPRAQRVARGTVVETLYDLSSDPGETTNAAGRLPERLAEMRKLMDKAHDALHRTAGAKAGKAKLDQATRERLRALGYLD